jgi:hypothetical protein
MDLWGYTRNTYKILIYKPLRDLAVQKINKTWTMEGTG